MKSLNQDYINEQKKILQTTCDNVYQKAYAIDKTFERNVDGFNQYDIGVCSYSEAELEKNNFYLDTIFMFSKKLNIKVGCKYIPKYKTATFWYEPLIEKIQKISDMYGPEYEELDKIIENGIKT